MYLIIHMIILTLICNNVRIYVYVYIYIYTRTAHLLPQPIKRIQGPSDASNT